MNASRRSWRSPAAGGSTKKVATRRLGLCLIIPIASCLICSYTLINADKWWPVQPVQCPLGEDYHAPAWSPDGSQVAFEASGVICVMQADGTKVEGLTAGEAPSWSPDGQHIIFSSGACHSFIRPGSCDVYEMNRDGSQVFRLIPPGSGAFDPAWSPDGRLIAFNSYVKGGIWLYHLDGSAETQLTDSPGAGDPQWSPDSRRIAFVMSGDPRGAGVIAVIGADGQNYKQLTDKDLSPTPLGRFSLTWSPDGLRIAFSTDSAGTSNIWVMNADGSNVVQLTRKVCDDLDPAWSPDGSRIVFVSDCNNLAVVNKRVNGIYVMNTDGSNRRPLIGIVGR